MERYEKSLYETLNKCEEKRKEKKNKDFFIDWKEKVFM